MSRDRRPRLYFSPSLFALPPSFYPVLPIFSGNSPLFSIFTMLLLCALLQGGLLSRDDPVGVLGSFWESTSGWELGFRSIGEIPQLQLCLAPRWRPEEAHPEGCNAYANELGTRSPDWCLWVSACRGALPGSLAAPG